MLVNTSPGPWTGLMSIMVTYFHRESSRSSPVLPGKEVGKGKYVSPYMSLESILEMVFSSALSRSRMAYLKLFD